MGIDIYNGKNPLDMPLYTYADASRYIKLPNSTVLSWARGRKQGDSFYEPLIEPAGDELLPLSFHNLVELHVLSSLKKAHKISAPTIRKALDYSKNELKIPRIFLTEDILTYEKDVFLDYLGDIINLSKAGQIGLRSLLGKYLKRVERDSNNMPIKLYPINNNFPELSPVSIDPKVAFGRPVVDGTNIDSRVIINRIDAGEDISAVAKGHRIKESIIMDVIAFEFTNKKVKQG